MKFIFKASFTYCLLIIAFSAHGQTDSLPETKPQRFHLRGYLKDLQTATWTPEEGSLLTGNFIHNRLNFRYDISNSLSARLEMRTRLFWGEEVRWTPDFAQQIGYDDGLMDLSWILVDKPAAVLHTTADRLLLNWRYRHWDVTLGRQRVNWGVTTVWNPNDLFNAYNFFDFDYEERPGSDALRVRYFTSGMSNLDAAVSRGRDPASTIAAFLYRFNRWGYDFQVLSGTYLDDLVLGAGWAGSIGDAGFKGEATWFQPREAFWDTTGAVSATVSGDYSFADGWYVGGAFLYTSSGTNDPAAIDSLATWEFSAKTLMPFKYSVLGQVAKQITPLFNMNMSVIYCPVVDALIVFPVLTYSVSDNWDMDLVMQTFFAPQDDKFKNQGNMLFLRLKWGF